MQYCLTPGCSVIVTRGRCATHARQADQGTRGTANARGYTARWATYSKARLQRLPVCGMQEDGSVRGDLGSRCAQQGLTTRAECTDHIVPVRQGGDFWNPANHQSLCNACNAAKMNTLDKESYAARV